MTHGTSSLRSSPDTSEIYQETVRSFGQQADVYRPAIKEYWNCVVHETALSLDLDGDWPSRGILNHVQYSLPILVEDLPFTLPIIFIDTRSLGKSLRLASNLLPKGGFLLMSNSIRCGSAASKASMLLIPPMASFRTATRPICATCFI